MGKHTKNATNDAGKGVINKAKLKAAPQPIALEQVLFTRMPCLTLPREGAGPRRRRAPAPHRRQQRYVLQPPHAVRNDMWCAANAKAPLCTDDAHWGNGYGQFEQWDTHAS